MRVRTVSGLFTYPDVVAACGEPRFDDDEFDTLLNPTLVVEVLSKSTESYDRRTKIEHYRTIPSLVEIVFIAEDRVRVERWHRGADGRGSRPAYPVPGLRGRASLPARTG